MGRFDFAAQSRWIRNTRDQIINVRGELSNPTQRTPLTATTTAQPITITSGGKSIRIMNFGTKDCYYGDADVTAANGHPLFSNGVAVTFENVKKDFVIYFITASDTTELRIVEY